MTNPPAENRTLDADEADYAKRLYDTLLDAILGLEDPGSGMVGVVRPHLIRMTLADLAATVDNNCQLAPTPGARRRLGEDIAKRYVQLSRSLAELDACGGAVLPKASIIASGTAH